MRKGVRSQAVPSLKLTIETVTRKPSFVHLQGNQPVLGPLLLWPSATDTLQLIWQTIDSDPERP